MGRGRLPPCLPAEFSNTFRSAGTEAPELTRLRTTRARPRDGAAPPGPHPGRPCRPQPGTRAGPPDSRRVSATRRNSPGAVLRGTEGDAVPPPCPPPRSSGRRKSPHKPAPQLRRRAELRPPCGSSRGSSRPPPPVSLRAARAAARSPQPARSPVQTHGAAARPGPARPPARSSGQTRSRPGPERSALRPRGAAPPGDPAPVLRRPRARSHSTCSIVRPRGPFCGRSSRSPRPSPSPSGAGTAAGPRRLRAAPAAGSAALGSPAGRGAAPFAAGLVCAAPRTRSAALPHSHSCSLSSAIAFGFVFIAQPGLIRAPTAPGGIDVVTAHGQQQ